MLESIQELPADTSDDDNDNETNIEDYKVIADSISKEIGDANKKGVEDQCSVYRSSKTEIVQHTFPCTYPPENQIKGKYGVYGKQYYTPNPLTLVLILLFIFVKNLNQLKQNN